MNGKKKTAAVALAAVFACGALAGCDALTVRNLNEDYNRTVATVDISTSESFKEGKEFAGLAEAAGAASIEKRELVLSFLSNGSSLVQSYGMSVEQAFDYLLDNLIQREAYVQYAKVYFLKNGDADKHTYTLANYKAAIAAAGAEASEAKKEAAGLGYFLTKAEKDKAEYDLRVAINGAIDNQEKGLIKAAEGDAASDEETRTLPTGADAEDEDFYDTKYSIYTGKETNLGTYEKLDGSTVATRKAAYNLFITNLYSGDQLKKGEDTTKLEETDYYARQLVSQYQSALLNKISDKFEQEATQKLSEEIPDQGTWAKGVYEEALANQKAEYAEDKSAFEDAFNAVSDTSFVLTPYDEEYGYVINILLPFSTLQSEELNSFTSDLGDTKGNSYAARARLLQRVKGTDQRGTWFTGETDHSYEGTGYTAEDSDRKYLFFENSFEKSDDVVEEEDVTMTAQYEKIKNYFGKYTYNGTVTFDEDGEAEKAEPNPIDINGFLDEMKNYMAYAGEQTEQSGLTFEVERAGSSEYFTREYEDFYKADGKVDYDAFIYEVGKVKAFKDGKFNANRMFVEGTPENVAFSVMNELSFAYNTDTAGLNTYLGYMISPFTTSYMKEFEYAAQLAVRGGAGTYVVVPTDYGWHIIYCTFSFKDAEGGAAFTFDQTQAKGGTDETENSFSWLFFEQLKSQVIQTAVSSRQSDILAQYAEACSTKFEYVYKDLLSL